MNTETKINHKLIGYLFTPSWLSGLICITVALLVTAATITSLQFSGSNLKLLYEDYRTSESSNRSAETAMLGTGSDAKTKLISSSPLLVFWALVGFIVYLLATNLIGVLRRAGEVTHELEFVNGNRRKLIMSVVGRFLVRCVVVAIWLPYILFFFHSIVPYVLTAATAGGILSTDGVLSAFLSIAVMATALHVHAILLRATLLKPRVLSRALYVS